MTNDEVTEVVEIFKNILSEDKDYKIRVIINKDGYQRQLITDFNNVSCNTKTGYMKIKTLDVNLCSPNIESIFIIPFYDVVLMNLEKEIKSC